MESAKMGTDVLEPSKDGFSGSNEWNKEYVDMSEVVNSPSGNYTEFPSNFVAFFALILMKFMGFQFNLLVSFFTYAIWLSYFPFMFLMFPFQTIRHVRGYFMKKLFRWWGISTRNVSQKAPQSIGNIAMRFGCAFFWSSHACLMLLLHEK
jgi:seipin